MINYSETKTGDILKIVGNGAPGYAQIGELVRVTKVTQNSVTVENCDGATANFVMSCGAARLEKTKETELG